jgi:N-acetylmuramic acid 6-phosphate (MurNAc-6-P) etherase
LRQIFSVDEDISKKFSLISRDTTLLTQAACAVSRAIREKKKIYIYGCGSTGRLSKQMESAVWRPFWTKVKRQYFWKKLKSSLPEDIEDRLIGEMTGGDRALISSLEGFEDLQLMGQLQLQDRGVEKGDAVFCITEGGETSSVIGTVLEALNLYGSLTEETIKEAGNHLYFIYNNPDDVLLPFERSRRVIEHPAITKICLTTGPQAITGSTRMQATTSETYVMGLILEAGIYDILNCAERSPTFHLFPLDTIHEDKRKCWLQVWTEAEDSQNAWKKFLGRNFRGLDEGFYKETFETEIHDPYLKNAALNSLSKAGSDQENLYNFSFSGDNITQRGPRQGDLGVLVCRDEEIDELSISNSCSRKFMNLFKEKDALVALILVGEKPREDVEHLLRQTPLEKDKDVVLYFRIDRKEDPLNLKREILLKILLNGHSTGVMARLGKVVGNTMTNVNPSNLKLIGRATHLIHSHVNDHVPITYDEANAVLFDAIDFLKERGRQTSEVELSIIRIMETFRKKRGISWDKALLIAETEGLEQYLKEYNPAIHS